MMWLLKLEMKIQEGKKALVGEDIELSAILTSLKNTAHLNFVVYICHNYLAILLLLAPYTVYCECLWYFDFNSSIYIPRNRIGSS